MLVPTWREIIKVCILAKIFLNQIPLKIYIVIEVFIRYLEIIYILYCARVFFKLSCARREAPRRMFAIANILAKLN